LAAAAAVALVGAAPAAAATHADPAGDNCKVYGTATFCGFDISSATDTADANGTVHLQLSYAATNCAGNGISDPARPSFEIYDTSVTAPAPFGPHMIAVLEPVQPSAYRIRQLSGGMVTTTTALSPTTTVAGATTTFDVAIPPAIASALGSFRWLGSNTCIGESPSEASDIVPNTGLFDHATAGGGTPVVTKAAITNAVKASLAGAKATSATTLLAKGGFPVRLTAPGAGKLKVTLARIKFIRLGGIDARVRRQVTTIATLTVNVTKAGTVKQTVKLTSAGRKLLKSARTKLSATLTVAFTSGTLSVSKSKTTKIAPRKR
jgi:hypothetical protein